MDANRLTEGVNEVASVHAHAGDALEAVLLVVGRRLVLVEEAGDSEDHVVELGAVAAAEVERSGVATGVLVVRVVQRGEQHLALAVIEVMTDDVDREVDAVRGSLGRHCGGGDGVAHFESPVLSTVETAGAYSATHR